MKKTILFAMVLLSSLMMGSCALKNDASSLNDKVTDSSFETGYQKFKTLDNGAAVYALYIDGLLSNVTCLVNNKDEVPSVNPNDYPLKGDADFAAKVHLDNLFVKRNSGNGQKYKKYEITTCTSYALLIDNEYHIVNRYQVRYCGEVTMLDEIYLDTYLKESIPLEQVLNLFGRID